MQLLNADRPEPEALLPPPRTKTKQANAPKFDVRSMLYQLTGTDLTLIHGIGPSIALSLVAKCGTDLSKRPTEKHFTSWLCLSPGCKISGGKVLSSHTRKSSSRLASQLRLAAVNVGRTETGLGAFYRRLAARIGKAKAVTATARKIAILFYRTIRSGMQYVDPGVDQYAQRYRELANAWSSNFNGAPLTLDSPYSRPRLVLLRKGLGVELQLLTNREKALLVDALRQTQELPALLTRLGLARSSYFYHRARLQVADKYGDVRWTIADIFEHNHRCYGNRRMRASLGRQDVSISEKVVQRLMKQEWLVVAAKRRRRYASYMGEIGPAPENLIDRGFQATAPDEKWLTDITELQIPAGKVYLSRSSTASTGWSSAGPLAHVQTPSL